MQLAILIKDAFLEVFMMIPLWALVHYGLLCALLAPSVVCKNMSSLDLICDCASKVSLSLLFYICIYCFYLGFL